MKPPSNRDIRIALGLTAILLFFLVFLGTVLDDPRGFDFVVLYKAGWTLRQGHAAKLYDLEDQAKTERELLNRGNVLVNIHVPFEALLFAPLARLAYVKAYLLWGVINVLLWLFFQHLLRPHAPIPRHPYRYFLLCSLFFPLWVTLMQGQTSLLLLLCFSLAFVCLKRNRDFTAGAALGLGLFKFPVVLPFVLICLLRKKWRLIGGFSLVALLLGVLSLAAVGLAGVVSYVNLLRDTGRNPANPAYLTIKLWNMPTLRGLFNALTAGAVPAVVINAVAALVSATLIAYTAWRWHRAERGEGPTSLPLMFAAALVVSLVTAPYLYTHDLTLVLLAVLLVLGSAQWPGRSGERTVLVAAMVILYAAPVYVVLLKVEAMSALAPVLVAFALAALSLAGKVASPPSAGGRRWPTARAVG